MRLDDMVDLCERAFLRRQALGLHSNITIMHSVRAIWFSRHPHGAAALGLYTITAFSAQRYPNTHGAQHYTSSTAASMHSICMFLVTDVSISNSKH